MNTFLEFLQQGFLHVIPLGYDHILFVIALFFLNSRLRSVIIQCSAFTIAHSITLCLTAFKFILPNPSIIEPIIALSIVFVSLENIFMSNVSTWRIGLIFIFGLIHGMGFANALLELGIPQDHFIVSLLSFNLGVEFAQVSIILLLYFLISKWFANKKWYKNRIVYPVSTLIACIAMYWFVIRLFN